MSRKVIGRALLIIGTSSLGIALLSIIVQPEVSWDTTLILVVLGLAIIGVSAFFSGLKDVVDLVDRWWPMKRNPCGNITLNLSDFLQRFREEVIPAFEKENFDEASFVYKSWINQLIEFLHTCLPEDEHRFFQLVPRAKEVDYLLVIDRNGKYFADFLLQGKGKAIILFLEQLINEAKKVASTELFEEPLQQKSQLATFGGGLIMQPSDALYKAFIVHGTDPTNKRDAVARLLTNLKIEPILLSEQPSLGQTIIEKLESHSDVKLAVVLLTGDDAGGRSPDQLQPRARQNVIYELGYFHGLLGRKRLVVLYEPDVEMPSNISGIVYLKIDNEGRWKFELAKELKARGLNVDISRIS